MTSPAGQGNASPLVSVIVRSMARPSLDATLASLAAQTHEALEVVLVLASGPGHPSVPAQVGPHPVRAVSTGALLPRAAAANAGLDAAGGEWLTFLDDDDVFLPEHVAGLLAAAAEHPHVDVVHCLARAVFADGRIEKFGQPHARLELFDRNYLHLSAAVIRRNAAVQCRFDETLDVHEDWDFFLQLAETVTFAFVPNDTFVWHADAGSSGAGGGRNQDDTRFAHYRDRVYAKWTPQRDALVERVMASLEPAQVEVQRGHYARAEALCRAVLADSPNDPWTLNLLAMIKRSMGDLAGARAAQELALAVHPNDAAFAHNLALLCIAQHDFVRARQCVEQALAADPTFAPALNLKDRLATAVH